MDYKPLREALTGYYLHESFDRADRFREKIVPMLDEYDRSHPGADIFELKTAMYDTIADNIEPLLFDGVPFYYETGALCAYSDGLSGRGTRSANGWLSDRNGHVFRDADPAAYDLHCRNKGDKLYLTCGPYVDNEHYQLNYERIFEIGLSGVRAQAADALANCENAHETGFVRCCIAGIDAVQRIALRFAGAAEEKLTRTTDEAEKARLLRIVRTAPEVPWRAPRTFYEGLCTLAFLRRAVGSLEGVGYNSFGRIDKLLGPLYERDLAGGVTREEMYDDLCRFILMWDCHLDRTRKMERYSDYEYENSMTVGGLNADGSEVFNEVTKMLIGSELELGAIFPKIMCRYSARSSEEYLRLISEPTLRGDSILLYENDDSIIPALIKSGAGREDAYAYTVTGCWGIAIAENAKTRGGEYLNVLRTLEWAVHRPEERIRANGLEFEYFDGCQSFEEIYGVYLRNCEKVMRQKAELNARGARHAIDYNPVCLTSAFMNDCLARRRDCVEGGSRYASETMSLSGFADAIDSLLAIKKLCFDDKVCTLAELLDACRADWDGERYAELQHAALKCPKHGDGSEESARLAARLNDDFYDISVTLPTAYGGVTRMGYYMYTEVIWWGLDTLATPNGRHSGDYLAHGLTPSRLCRIASVSNVFAGLRYFDFSKSSANGLMNVLLPTGMTSDAMVAFFRGCAAAMTQALQVNCVSRDELLEAQKHPEQYGHIVVRVTGFSAPFVMLSEQWQTEFLTRNYYNG